MDKYILRQTHQGFLVFLVREMGRKQRIGRIDREGVINLIDDLTVPADLRAALENRKAFEAEAANAEVLDLASRIANACTMIEGDAFGLTESSADLLVKAAFDLRSAVVSATIERQTSHNDPDAQAPEFHMDLALHLARQDRHSEALESLIRAERGGYSNRAYLNEIKAGVCLSLNDIDAALDALSLACAGHASPARPARALLTRFLKKKQGGRFSAWLRMFADGVEQSWVHHLLAQIALHDGNDALAIKENRKALALDRTNLSAARAVVDAAFKMNDMTLAREVFDTAAPNVKQAAHMQNALARLLMDEKDFTAAIAATASAVEQEPENSNFWFIRGISLRRGDQVSDALAAFEKAVTLNPSAAFSFHNLSLCAAQLGDKELALVNAQKAVGLAPDNKSFNSNLVSLGGVAPEKPATPSTTKPRARGKTSAKTTARKPNKNQNANWPRLG